MPHVLLTFAIAAVPALRDIPEAKSIFAELTLPSLNGKAEPPPAFAVVPGTLKPYAADVTVDEILKDTGKYKLRAKTLAALQAIRDSWAPAKPEDGLVRLTEAPAPLTDAFKKTVRDAQDPAALVIAKLELELIELEAVAELRAEEPKRWQAHYDFALAELRHRLAWLSEYNRALGNVRTESLPALPAGSPGWRLVPAKQIQGRPEVQSLSDKANDSFKALADTHKGTPWEALAKHALATSPGLTWEPLPKPK